jgi:hypothetical protein
MRRVFRGIGWVFLVASLGLLSHDLIAWIRSGTFALTDTGALWFAIHPTSLQLAEPAIARYIHPFLWHPVATSLLLTPAFVVVGMLSALSLVITWPRTHHRLTSGDLFR